MKTRINLALLMTAFVFCSPVSFAQEVRNGGGEDGVFKSIRDEIKVWIDKNQRIGKLGQKLGIENAAELLARFNLAVEQVGERVVFTHATIDIEGNVRICKNEPELSTITCNVDAWNHTRGDTRYMVVLHEYLGIARIESNILQYSRYPISPKVLSFVHSREAFELGMEKVELGVPSDERELDLSAVFNGKTQKRIGDLISQRHGLPLSYLSPLRLKGVDQQVRTYSFDFFNRSEPMAFGVSCQVELDVQTFYPRNEQFHVQVKQHSVDRSVQFEQLLKYDRVATLTVDHYINQMIDSIVSSYSVRKEDLVELLRLPVKSTFLRTVFRVLETGNFQYLPEASLNPSEQLRAQSLLQQAQQHQQQEQQTQQQDLQARMQQDQQPMKRLTQQEQQAEQQAQQAEQQAVQQAQQRAQQRAQQQQQDQQQRQQQSQQQQAQQQQAHALAPEIEARVVALRTVCNSYRVKGGTSVEELKKSNSEFLRFVRTHNLINEDPLSSILP